MFDIDEASTVSTYLGSLLSHEELEGHWCLCSQSQKSFGADYLCLLSYLYRLIQKLCLLLLQELFLFDWPLY